MELYIVTFKHGNYAVAAYSRLESIKVPNVRLASVPFSIRSECDLCIKTNNTDSLRSVIRECKGKYPIDNIYSAIRQNGTFIYKVLPMIID